MRVPRLCLTALALASGIALSGCAYDMYGDGYGGYGSYGVGIGYGGYSGYGGYGYGGYPYGYGYGGYGGYGYDPFGWYGDYYYPGSGIYVYDRYRTRHVWNDTQRRYWEQRRSQWHDHHSGTTTGTNENWSGWDHSRWQNRDYPTTTTTTSGGDRGNWRNRSSVTTSGVQGTRDTSGDQSAPRHHWRDRGNDHQ
jgi:hypothetical protein